MITLRLSFAIALFLKVMPISQVAIQDLHASSSIKNDKDLIPIDQHKDSRVESKLPIRLIHINKIIDNYDIFLVDVIGVVHNGSDPFPEAIKTLQVLQELKKVIFLSNMPRPGHINQKKLIDMGLSKDTVLFTSGDAVRQDLQGQFANKKIYHWGAERNKDILVDIEINLAENIEDAEMVLLTQYIEQDEKIDQFDKLIDIIIEKKIPVLCANPDKVAPNGELLRYCAGTFAAKIEERRGNVKYYGKPNSLIYEIIHKTYNQNENSKDRMIMIGDTLETDIKGAQDYGIDSILILTGITAHDCKKENKEIEVYLEQYRQKHQTAPRYFMDELQFK